MKHISFFIVLLFLLGGCASSRRLTDSVNRQDSVRIEIRKVIEYITDTLIIEIPAQGVERHTADSVSYLETDYAESDARINSDGTLSHSLKNKPQNKKQEYQRPVERNDSIVYKYKAKTVTKTVQVERDLTWWEKTQIVGFWAVIIFLMIVYRRNIFAFIVRLILIK